MKTKLQLSLIMLSIVGLLDALYLSYARYMHIDLPCSITNGGCAVVAASPYSVMFGVPLAYLGVAFYIAMLAVSVLLHFKPNICKYMFELVFLVVTFASLDSLYFLYLQGFVIKAFCIYCIISAVITFSMFTITAVLYYTDTYKIKK